MSDDSLARSQPATPPSADEGYDAIHATIVATERGRWFLDEYARRYRGVDTDIALAALARIEQAIRGDSAAVPPDDGDRTVLAGLAETVRQARSEVMDRHGDPAASGEAALAEFRNAAGQIQELVWAAQSQEAGAELRAQLSFQISRLLGAGERLESSVGALQVLLGVLDDLDQRLRPLRQAPEPAGEAVVEPALPPLVTAAAAEWSPAETLSSPEPAPEPAPRPTPLAGQMLADERPEELPTLPERTRAGPWWDTVAPDAADVFGRDTVVPAPAAEADLADWAFAPPDKATEPLDPAHRPLRSADLWSSADEPLVESPASALERLEAREFGRRRAETTDKTLPPGGDAGSWPDTSPPSRDDAFDDLVQGEGSIPAALSRPFAAPEWTTETQTALPAVEPIFDADLFDTDESAAEAERPSPVDLTGLAAPDVETDPGDAGGDHRLSPPLERPTAHDFLQVEAEPLPAMPAGSLEAESASEWLAPHPRLPVEGPQPSEPSMQERLENVRSAIATLMKEVDEKTERTARRFPPPPR
jgi:hypothetical protein